MQDRNREGMALATQATIPLANKVAFEIITTEIAFIKDITKLRDNLNDEQILKAESEFGHIVKTLGHIIANYPRLDIPADQFNSTEIQYDSITQLLTLYDQVFDLQALMQNDETRKSDTHYAKHMLDFMFYSYDYSNLLTKHMKMIMDEKRLNPGGFMNEYSNFLIKPVQRLPKFPLFFRNLIENLERRQTELNTLSINASDKDKQKNNEELRLLNELIKKSQESLAKSEKFLGAINKYKTRYQGNDSIMFLNDTLDREDLLKYCINNTITITKSTYVVNHNKLYYYNFRDKSVNEITISFKNRSLISLLNSKTPQAQNKELKDITQSQLDTINKISSKKKINQYIKSILAGSTNQRMVAEKDLSSFYCMLRSDELLKELAQQETTKKQEQQEISPQTDLEELENATNLTTRQEKNIAALRQSCLAAYNRTDDTEENNYTMASKRVKNAAHTMTLRANKRQSVILNTQFEITDHLSLLNHAESLTPEQINDTRSIVTLIAADNVSSYHLTTINSNLTDMIEAEREYQYTAITQKIQKCRTSLNTLRSINATNGTKHIVNKAANHATGFSADHNNYNIIVGHICECLRSLQWLNENAYNQMNQEFDALILKFPAETKISKTQISEFTTLLDKMENALSTKNKQQEINTRKGSAETLQSMFAPNTVTSLTSQSNQLAAQHASQLSISAVKSSYDQLNSMNSTDNSDTDKIKEKDYLYISADNDNDNEKEKEEEEEVDDFDADDKKDESKEEKEKEEEEEENNNNHDRNAASADFRDAKQNSNAIKQDLSPGEKIEKLTLLHGYYEAYLRNNDKRKLLEKYFQVINKYNFPELSKLLPEESASKNSAAFDTFFGQEYDTLNNELTREVNKTAYEKFKMPANTSNNNNSFFSRPSAAASALVKQFFPNTFSGHQNFVAGFTISTTLALVVGLAVTGALIGAAAGGVGALPGAFIGAFVGVAIAFFPGSVAAYIVGNAIAYAAEKVGILNTVKSTSTLLVI